MEVILYSKEWYTRCCPLNGGVYSQSGYQWLVETVLLLLLISYLPIAPNLSVQTY